MRQSRGLARDSTQIGKVGVGCRNSDRNGEKQFLIVTLFLIISAILLGFKVKSRFFEYYLTKTEN